MNQTASIRGPPFEIDPIDPSTYFLERSVSTQ